MSNAKQPHLEGPADDVEELSCPGVHVGRVDTELPGTVVSILDALPVKRAGKATFAFVTLNVVGVVLPNEASCAGVRAEVADGSGQKSMVISASQQLRPVMWPR